VKLKNNLSFVKRIGFDSLVYGLGSALGKVIPFLLLPFYTKYLEPSDYGVIEMLSIVSAFLTSLINLGLDSAQSFFFFKFKSDRYRSQKEYVSAILFFRFVWGGIFLLLFFFLAPFFNSLLFNSKFNLVSFYISFSTLFFYLIMSQGQEIFRLRFQSFNYIIVSLVYSLFSSIISLVGVLQFPDIKIIAFLSGPAIASFFMACFVWFSNREYIILKLPKFDKIREVYRFGLPLFPADIFFYLMTSADKWLINFFLGSAALGIYAVASKFAMIMTLAVEVFRKAWWPISLELMHKDVKFGHEVLLNYVTKIYFGLCISFLIYLAFFSEFLINTMTAPQYHNAYILVGFLGLQSIFNGSDLIFSFGIWKAGKTSINLVCIAVAAVLNFLFCYFLIPLYGIVGASASTALAYFSWNLLSIFISVKYYQIQFNYIFFIGQILFGVLAICIINSKILSNLHLFLFLNFITIIFLYVSLKQTSSRRPNNP